ncbi:hypothetical protein CDV36_011409 [Fusarium kuroshium]|uniref:Uncharacterized protein n=2 Tax=Fusarium solani species complex TaxID=232080 RepID=A0A3M2RVP7_9HYPO|nr:hypothetical protein CDV36_011409 [Fusarium kuroshium]RSL77360.1 hypothetical protein CEP51_009150 [Fusarium floridanum]
MSSAASFTTLISSSALDTDSGDSICNAFPLAQRIEQIPVVLVVKEAVTQVVYMSGGEVSEPAVVEGMDDVFRYAVVSE